MLKLPDKNMLDMRWKSVSYIMGEMKMVFTIIPMLEGPDIVCIPKEKQFSNSVDVKKRNEFIFLLQSVEWQRDLAILEMNIHPNILKKDTEVDSLGSLEKTEGGQKLEKSYLFNPKSPLTKQQVREIYIQLETKFAQSVTGEIEIIKNGTLKGSILEKVVLPILEKNTNVKIIYI